MITFISKPVYYLPEDKAKPAKRQGRKATGPRFLRDDACDATKDPKIAGLPVSRHRAAKTLCVWAASDKEVLKMYKKQLLSFFGMVLALHENVG